MLRTPNADLAALIGSAPITGGTDRAGPPCYPPLPSPFRAIAYALAGAIAFGTVSAGAFAYANRPLPAPQAPRMHMPAAYTPSPVPTRFAYRP